MHAGDLRSSEHDAFVCTVHATCAHDRLSAALCHCVSTCALLAVDARTRWSVGRSVSPSLDCGSLCCLLDLSVAPLAGRPRLRTPAAVFYSNTVGRSYVTPPSNCPRAHTGAQHTNGRLHCPLVCPLQHRPQ